MDKNVKEILQAVGALSETTALFYKQLIDNNIPPDHAAQITCAYVRATLMGGRNDG